MGASAGANKKGKNAKKKKEWKKPSDASKKELAEVSAFLLKELTAASPNDDTEADVYQDKCADKFGQEFDGDEWNDWFDKEIDKLEKEAAKGAKASAGANKKGKNAKKKKEWKKPSDAPKKELAEVSAFLLKELAAAGPNDDTEADVYQDKCADKFGQEFEGDEWEDWFDKEIEKLAKEAAKGAKASAGANKKGKMAKKKKEWKKPSD